MILRTQYDVLAKPKTRKHTLTKNYTKINSLLVYNHYIYFKSYFANNFKIDVCAHPSKPENKLI